MDFRSPVVVTPPLEAVEELEATPIDDQPTVRSMTQKVLDCINDEILRFLVCMVMRGIGKTALMENVHNRLRSNCRFDIVIWVTVSRNPNMASIHRKIGDRLCLDLSGVEVECKR
ncbi:hypothetical protein AMTRI_Chr05g58210 [Amborella trichopoda]